MQACTRVPCRIARVSTRVRAGATAEAARHHRGQRSEATPLPPRATCDGAPRPPASWRGIRDATQYAPSCRQKPSLFEPRGPQSENCLYLNVSTRTLRRDAKRPVLVWIHGGGFTQDGAPQRRHQTGSRRRRRHGQVVALPGRDLRQDVRGPGGLPGSDRRLLGPCTGRLAGQRVPGRRHPGRRRQDAEGQDRHAEHDVPSLATPQPQVETGFATTHHCSFWATG